jgi:putative flippase GtrA
MRLGSTPSRSTARHVALAWPAFAEPLRRHATVLQLLRYALVSGAALPLDFAVFLSLNAAIGHPTLSGVAGYAVGIVVHYFLSCRFVFDAARSRKAAHRVFAEFVASGLVGLAMTAAVIALATGMFGMTPIVAKVIAVGASFLGVFLIRRSIVFA